MQIDGTGSRNHPTHLRSSKPNQAPPKNVNTPIINYRAHAQPVAALGNLLGFHFGVLETAGISDSNSPVAAVREFDLAELLLDCLPQFNLVDVTQDKHRLDDLTDRRENERIGILWRNRCPCAFRAKIVISAKDEVETLTDRGQKICALSAGISSMESSAA